MLEPRYGIERGWPIAPGQQVLDVQPIGFLPSTDPDIIGVPALALTFSDQTPLQFADGKFLEFSA